MNKTVMQLAIFQTTQLPKLREAINGSLIEIATLGHTYVRHRVWTDVKGAIIYYHGMVEYEMPLETLIGHIPDKREDRINLLKEYKFNLSHNINELGFIGVQAFIVQNDIFDITFEETKAQLISRIKGEININNVQSVGDIEVQIRRDKLNSV